MVFGFIFFDQSLNIGSNSFQLFKPLSKCTLHWEGNTLKNMTMIIDDCGSDGDDNEDDVMSL